MLNAVWVAVIVAAAFWVVAVCAAVFLMLRAARLVTAATGAMSELRAQHELVVQRANATIDAAGEQLIRTDAITSSMDEITANMAALTGRVAALAPLARLIGESAGSPLGKVIAMAYGLNRALWLRRPAAVRPAVTPAPKRALTTRRPGGAR